MEDRHYLLRARYTMVSGDPRSVRLRWGAFLGGAGNSYWSTRARADGTALMTVLKAPGTSVAAAYRSRISFGVSGGAPAEVVLNALVAIPLS
jgi:hypothetical protein